MKGDQSHRSIVVIGATGKTGVHCLKHALGTGGRCAAVARTASGAKLKAFATQHTEAGDRLMLYPIDMTSAEAVSRVFDDAQPDSVILNLPSMPGSPSGWTTSVTEAVLGAAKEHPGTRKFVSTAGVASSGLREGERYRRSLRIQLVFFGMLFGSRLADMTEAFQLLRDQQLPYTIARGDELNDDPGTGNIHVGLAGHMPSKWVTRDDFGLFCVRATKPGVYDRDEPTICTLPNQTST